MVHLKDFERVLFSKTIVQNSSEFRTIVLEMRERKNTLVRGIDCDKYNV
jgi:hypothetical protein